MNCEQFFQVKKYFEVRWQVRNYSGVLCGMRKYFDIFTILPVHLALLFPPSGTVNIHSSRHSILMTQHSMIGIIGTSIDYIPLEKWSTAIKLKPKWSDGNQSIWMIIDGILAKNLGNLV